MQGETLFAQIKRIYSPVWTPFIALLYHGIVGDKIEPIEDEI